MRSPSLLLLAVLHILITPLPCNAASNSNPLGQEKVTNLHFYLHDTLSGKHPTAVLVAHADNVTGKPGDPTPFSSVYVIDDVLTEEPQRESKVLGNVQGLYVSSGKGDVPSLVLGVDYQLTDGPFNGSSFVVFSRNPISQTVDREMAIVGGRGAFRMARGYALLRTQYLDTANGDAIIEYNVTLLHY